MLSENEVRKIYEQVNNYCKENRKECNGLFDKVTDMVSAEWALNRQKILTTDYNIWNNVRYQLAKVLEIQVEE